MLGSWTSAPDFRNATLLFDGVAPAGCDRTHNEVSCRNIANMPDHLEFRYDDGERPGVVALSPFYVYFFDRECMDAWSQQDSCNG